MDRAASTKHDVLESMLLDESVEPTDLPSSLLEYITDDFSDDNLIGRGGFAEVYKGMLRNGSIIAVKKLFNNHLHENDFIKEAECLFKVKHQNVVRFLGYCADAQGKMERYNGKLVIGELPQRLLCFEYLPKGSLHDYFQDTSRDPEWTQCYKIIKGICAGLHYLHENGIVHLDLKPTNILLDDNMVPKIADFGLSRCFNEGQSHVITSKLYGTLGYIAPEVHCGRITFKSDMYSFGVIIIEILTGKKMYLEDYDELKIWENRLDKLHKEKQLEQLRVCAEIGKECTDYDPRKRPDAWAIFRRLDDADIVNESIVTDMSNLSIAQEIHKAEEPGDGNPLFRAIGRELSLKCLLQLSRSDYGTVASLSRNFRSLVRSGEIYRLRRQSGVAEHWMYIFSGMDVWYTYDLERRCWIQTPIMPGDYGFIFGNKLSLSVGTNLLVFGMDNSKRLTLLRYSILTNSWIPMTDVMSCYPYYQFGSTSVGQKAYLVGGIDFKNHMGSPITVSAATMYDSEENVWEPLPSMNRARWWCSAAFMDRKLYVLGGLDDRGTVLYCGEEYDFERRSWMVIENMLSEAINQQVKAGVYPTVGVVNNELYAVDYREMNVIKYDKQNNRWITLGKLPECFLTTIEQQFGLKACGDKLIIVGISLSSIHGDGMALEIYSWVPSEQPPAWNFIDRHPSVSFLYDFVVMSC